MSWSIDTLAWCGEPPFEDDREPAGCSACDVGEDESDLDHCHWCRETYCTWHLRYQHRTRRRYCRACWEAADAEVADAERGTVS